MMKKTKNGTAISPVVDIAPQINFGYHNRERVRDDRIGVIENEIK